MRDGQRAKVYRAEAFVKVPKAHERLDEVKDVQEWVDELTDTPWWASYMLPSENLKKHRQRKNLYTSIIVTDGRSRRSAAGGLGRIRMPRWSRTKLVILHEIGHAIQTEEPAHGRQFAGIYLDLVRRFLGKEAARQLKQGYVKSHVRSSPRRKPTRPGGEPNIRMHWAAWQARLAAEEAANRKLAAKKKP